MPMYEFRCVECNDQVVTDDREAEGHEIEAGDGEMGLCGPLKRTWSVGFQIKSTDWGH